MDRRIQIGAAVFLTVGVGALFYYVFIAPAQRFRQQSPEVAVTPAPDTGLMHPLNGVPVASEAEFFPVSVMYDNLNGIASHPGLDEARIVYEALAEGGITRLMAVFDSMQEVEKIGPVRSVRPYFIDWAREYGGALMHVGGSFEALQELKQIDEADLADIDQIGADEAYFTRDEALPAPHNVFTSFSSWRKFGERLDIAPRTVSPWAFAVATSTAGLKQQIDIQFAPGNRVSWVLRPDDGQYLRFMNGKRQQYAAGDQIAASTIVFVEVQSTTIDAIGRQRMKTVGSGTAAVYRAGSIVEGTWLKETRGSRMRFLGSDQQEITLNPGQIWIEAVPSLDSVTVSE